MNLYGYVYNAPLNYFDADGFEPVCSVSAAARAVASEGIPWNSATYRAGARAMAGRGTGAYGWSFMAGYATGDLVGYIPAGDATLHQHVEQGWENIFSEWYAEDQPQSVQNRPEIIGQGAAIAASAAAADVDNKTTTKPNKGSCCTDDAKRTCDCKAIRNITLYVVPAGGAPTTPLGHAFIAVPGLGSRGWSPVRVPNPLNEVLSGKVDDDSNLIPTAIVAKKYRACPSSIAAIGASITGNSILTYHLPNSKGRNCAGWASQVLQSAGFTPPMPPNTRFLRPESLIVP